MREQVSISAKPRKGMVQLLQTALCGVQTRAPPFNIGYDLHDFADDSHVLS
jgi:hypothetical protein